MRWLDGVAHSMDGSLSTLRDLVTDRAPGTLQPPGLEGQSGSTVGPAAEGGLCSKLQETLEPSSSFPGGSEGKASACNARDLGSIPESGRSSGEGNGNPLQYSCLENPMGRGAL